MLEVFLREKAAPGQGRVENCRRMPLAEDEPVALRPIGAGRVEAQLVEKERRHDLGRRQRAARMSCASAVNQVQAVEAQVARPLLQFENNVIPVDKP